MIIGDVNGQAFQLEDQHSVKQQGGEAAHMVIVEMGDQGGIQLVDEVLCHQLGEDGVATIDEQGHGVGGEQGG